MKLFRMEDHSFDDDDDILKYIHEDESIITNFLFEYLDRNNPADQESLVIIAVNTMANVLSILQECDISVQEYLEGI